MSDLPIPGSVHLVATGNGGELLEATHTTANGSIILHPHPSHDVNDPLNWSKNRKRIATFCLFVYTLTAGMGTTALYSVLTPIESNTGIPLSTLNAGTGYMFFLLGWGALINQPLALTFGKRPIYMISLLGNMACCIWMPYITSDGEWLANKVLQGFFVSPIESLIEISISDLYFAHERVTYIGLYAFTLFGSNYFAPLVAGFINDGQGWGWVMYWSAIWNAGGFLILFFLMEETNYVRAKPEAQTPAEEEASSSNEKKGDVIDHTIAMNEVDLDTYQAGRFPLVGEPTSYLASLKLFNRRYTSLTAFGKMIYRPLLLFRFPVVVWSGLLYGSSLVWYNVLNATASLLLTSAPYNFRSSMVGLMYLAPLIGAACSGLYAGWFGDRFSLWFARRKNGIREPEDRLWLMSVTVILCPAGLVLWGVGAANGIHWLGLAVGMAMSAFCTGVGGVLAIGYALDAYHELDGSVMTLVMCIRNSLSFAIGYGITPWLELGTQNTFISAAFVGMAVYASFLIVIRFGKKWRAESRALYWNIVAGKEGQGGS